MTSFFLVGRRALAATVAAAALAGLVSAADAHGVKVGDLTLQHPWTRATPPAPRSPAVLVIKNAGSAPDRLLGGSAGFADTVEVHEMKMDGDVMKMAPVEGGLEIPAGGEVALKPGSFHIMFTGLKHGLTQGEEEKGTLVFEKAGTVEVEWAVEAVGASQPAHAGHTPVTPPAPLLRGSGAGPDPRPDRRGGLRGPADFRRTTGSRDRRCYGDRRPLRVVGPAGGRVTDRDLLGKPFAIFFGYTHCPDCARPRSPKSTPRATRSASRRTHSPSCFVSVDPERDTPEASRTTWVPSPHPVLGLTGTPDEIKAITAGYKIFFEKVPGADGDYLMNHTAAVFLMGPDGALPGARSPSARTAHHGRQTPGRLLGTARPDGAAPSSRIPRSDLPGRPNGGTGSPDDTRSRRLHMTDITAEASPPATRGATGRLYFAACAGILRRPLRSPPSSSCWPRRA